MSKTIPITCKSDQLIPISQLENFQGKLKAIDEQSFNKLKESIVKYGFSFPIFVWGKKILDGHQRLAAVKRLIDDGYSVKGDKLPVVEIDAKSEQEAAEKPLLINSRYARIDQSGFDAFIADFDIDLADFSGLLEIPEIDFDFDRGGGGFDGNTDPDEVPDVQPDIVSKRGDIWILGEHRLMCGDSTCIDDIEALMAGENAGMIFTDPPYELSVEKIAISLKYCNDIVILCTFKQAIELCNNFHFHFDFVLIADLPKSFMNKLQPYYLHVNGLYLTNNGKPSFHCDNAKGVRSENGYWSTVIDAPRDISKHGHGKSVMAVNHILSGWDKAIIFDPFCGSGTTIIACQNKQKKCYAMEISEQNCDIIVKRYEDYTGDQAELIRK